MSETLSQLPAPISRPAMGDIVPVTMGYQGPSSGTTFAVPIGRLLSAANLIHAQDPAYGVVANGTTDDTTAWELALNAAFNLGAWVVAPVWFWFCVAAPVVAWLCGVAPVRFCGAAPVVVWLCGLTPVRFCGAAPVVVWLCVEAPARFCCWGACLPVCRWVSALALLWPYVAAPVRSCPCGCRDWRVWAPAGVSCRPPSDRRS